MAASIDELKSLKRQAQALVEVLDGIIKREEAAAASAERFGTPLGRSTRIE